MQSDFWPYLPTLQRLALALAIGLFVGMEREWRGKEAGLRTFGFGALLGCLGALLGPPYALTALGLLGILVILISVRAILFGRDLELTTSAALLVVGFAGVLAGLGHTLTPTAVAVVTAGLLAWKEPLAGFTGGLSVQELRSAILLAMLAFVIYPALPEEAVDPWGLISPRDSWATVILIAGLGFANYILLKVYGTRGVRVSGFLGGLVNSSIAVVELATLHRRAKHGLGNVVYQGVLLATAGTLVRNAVVLGLLAPRALVAAAASFALLFLPSVAFAVIGQRSDEEKSSDVPIELPSPFSITAALRFGLIFLAITVAGTVAERLLGDAGFYVASLIGGAVSSASTVATAAILTANGTLNPTVAGTGAVLATLTSIGINLTLAARVGADRRLTARLALALGITVLLGAVGIGIDRLLASSL
ncbi:MgtC/SapB family protein [Sphaerobacter thermophilus]|jgi:uncharacterized membrane protein (DUF4010 family)|uniref:MgtC/SapB family protein n=1 Tax=Sphaerobacter thermophilus TaxID=2057 RepID=UPI000DB61EC7|nr:MAG: magnesium transporter accessory protein [Sphaerobacter thermophilus]